MNTNNNTLATLTLTITSKLPCKSFDVTALACNVGSKLAQVEGSVCFKCYALGGFYRMANVASANQKRLTLMGQKGWVETMVKKIRSEESSGFFRWFSSGDLQSLNCLQKNMGSSQSITSFTDHSPKTSQSAYRLIWSTNPALTLWLLQWVSPPQRSQQIRNPLRLNAFAHRQRKVTNA